MNLDSHQIFTSRDVLFHEHIFPFKSSPLTDSVPYSPNFPILSFPNTILPATSPRTHQNAVATDHTDPTSSGSFTAPPIRKSTR